jgi:hypothetical protein
MKFRLPFPFTKRQTTVRINENFIVIMLRWSPGTLQKFHVSEIRGSFHQRKKSINSITNIFKLLKPWLFE